MDIEFDNPPFKARAYEDEYIEYVIYALDDSGEEDGAISGPHTNRALAEGIVQELIEDFPGEYFHVVAILRNGKDRLMDSEVVWSNYPDNESKKGESSDGADEDPYNVYSLDDETGRVSKDGVYPTWRKAYAALADGTVWDEGSSNNFVFHGNHLQQIYKYKKTGRTGKWSGNGYDVIFDREISEDPADYIKAHFTPTRYNACRFNESKGANEAAGEPSDVKDIAAYIKSLDPQTAPMYDAFGNKTGTVSFPKWYSDTKKLLFPCKFYSDADMNKIIKQGDEFISKKFGEGAYELTLEKVFSNAFHSNCYAVRIKPAVKEASGANETIEYEKGHKNSRGEDAPWVIRDHKDNSVLASFPTKKEAENHMRTMKRYSKTEGKFTEIKAAIKAAWSAAEAKWFRLDFQESTERLDVYPIASDNEGVGVNWGVLPERSTIVQYATDFGTGNSEVEREMPYKDLDELEKIFVDEFKSMDETLEVGADNGADIHPLTESRPTESEVDRFLHNALDWASIDDGENRVILKFIADAGPFALVGYDGRTQKTLTSGELFAVVDRYRELVEMDQADAIREFEKE